MSGSLTQDTRFGELTTPLGKDVLVLVRFDATEGLSELFEFRVECLSEQPDLNFDGAIGQQCKVKIKMFDPEREFSGILVEAQWTGISPGSSHLSARPPAVAVVIGPHDRLPHISGQEGARHHQGSIQRPRFQRLQIRAATKRLRARSSNTAFNIGKPTSTSSAD